MAEKRMSGGMRGILRGPDASHEFVSFDRPSADEVAAFLDAASCLPPRQLRRLVSLVREALADEAGSKNH